MVEDTEIQPRTEDLAFRLCYAPVRLVEMLGRADTRFRIRSLTISQLFFGLEELDDEGMRTLLPHITEEQWTGVLDLDLWSRDEAQVDRFLYWQRHILAALPAVARKLVRATDPELWQLTFKRRVSVLHKPPEEAGEAASGDSELMQTPDGYYQIILPENAEEARLLRALVLRLYELDPENTSFLLEASLGATSAELEEAAYQHRTRRTESLGYQDYFQAIDVYVSRSPREPLPQKTWEVGSPISLLPGQLAGTEERPLLLFEAAAALSAETEVQSFLEELLFVCNKIIAADRIPLGTPAQVRKAISKAIRGINLGIDTWSEGDLSRAVAGLREHYLQSFFQIAYGELMKLQDQARILQRRRPPEPGSFLEHTVQELLGLYPRLVRMQKGQIQTVFFTSQREVQEVVELLLPASEGVSAEEPRQIQGNGEKP